MSARKLDKVLTMLLTQDSVFAVLSPDFAPNRPTSDFYTVNDIYREVEAEELNFGDYAYRSLTLVNAPRQDEDFVPQDGTYAFFVHKGTNTCRFVPVDVQPAGKMLGGECWLGTYFQDTLKELVFKFQALGTYVVVDGSEVKVY